MKVYKCLILDESVEDWEPGLIAVMENYNEQVIYYDEHCYKSDSRLYLLRKSGYSENLYHDIDFYFPYYMDGIYYFDEIEANKTQYVWDTFYGNFEYVKPDKEVEIDD